MNQVLNCSRKSGSIITDQTASIRYEGEVATIYDCYCKARIVTNGSVSGYRINGCEYDKSIGAAFYKYLWYLFFKDNPSMIGKICAYDSFWDELDETVINSPASVFRILKVSGLNGLKSNCKELLSTQAIKKEGFSLEKADSEIQKVIRQNKEKSQEELFLIIKSLGLPQQKQWYIRLGSVRLDEFFGNVTKDYAISSINKILIDYQKENQSKDADVIEI